jgi:hypothetical protein
VRILAADANTKGDLFGRLVTDVFHTLGYTDSRLNIHKTGREIDVAARHRLEPRRAIGECKALDKPVGGSDLNKFAGALQLEMDEAPDDDVQGYFLSLSGFTETALEQEKQPAKARFVLLSGNDVEDQLVQGGAVVAPEVAQDAASRLVSTKSDLVLEGTPVLIAHDVGWIWLCQFGRDHDVTHFALIHADGRPLVSALAERVVAADQSLGGTLHECLYLAPQQAVSKAQLVEVDRQYRHYLLAELGEITLEGLPVDEEAGVRRIALENLYVPLRIRPASEARQRAVRPDASEEDDSQPDLEVDVDGSDAEEIGSVLSRESRLAILADPGSGKSTLVKRLAVAYASDEHRSKIADDLPDAGWLPLFIRCRTLGHDATESIREILSRIPERGEFPESREAFDDLVTSSLRTGKVLLLIDGLDEIANSKDRMRFVLQLRTFVATYPNVALVLTSRKAGFRAVGGAVSNICRWYELDDFSADDIHQLTRAWHATVIGESEKTEREADSLATTIIETDRVRRLARNPLLLTTLLLVKRWVGDLPRKRPILYEKAIEVLLMTWNVEAHEPIERDEAIPQLAFVAHSLTKQGSQRVSAKSLAKLLNAARKQMPEVLGFARITVSQFIDRIESRSSLLVMTGHEEEAGELVPVYEFRHLTFQEYLTAVALVDGYYDGHADGDRLAELLTPHFNDSQWYEVVALANVRAGRSAREIVGKMLEVARASEVEERADVAQVIKLLGRSLADEVQLPPQLVREVSAEYACIRRSSRIDTGLVGEILESRYGDVFQESVEEAFARKKSDYRGLSGMCSKITRWHQGEPTMANAEMTSWVSSALEGDEEIEAMRAALWIVPAVYENQVAIRSLSGDITERFQAWSRDLVTWCELGQSHMAYAGAWALAWLGKIDALAVVDRSRALRALLKHWQSAPTDEAQRQAAWAFCEIPEISRESKPFGEASAKLGDFAWRQFGTKPSESREDRRPAAIILGYYLEEPWSDDEIRELLSSADHQPGERAQFVADALNVEGAWQAEAWSAPIRGAR